MDKLIDLVKLQLEQLDFAVQETSFEAMTTSGEISCLRNIKMPDCDSSKLLLMFPQLFVMSKRSNITPAKGFFFIILMNAGEDLTTELRDLYTKYFPSKIAIVSQNSSGHLLAKWFKKSDTPQLFDIFLQQEIGL